MTAFLLQARRQWMLVAVLALAVGIAVQFALLIPTLSKVSAQARAGSQAKVRQCQTAPIAAKLFVHAELSGWISAKDLALVYRTIPDLHCPTS